MSAIKYVWKNDESTLKKSPSLKTLNAYLDRNHTTECPSTGSWRGNLFYFVLDNVMEFHNIDALTYAF